jgi:hypothetical protein
MGQVEDTWQTENADFIILLGICSRAMRKESEDFHL